MLVSLYWSDNNLSTKRPFEQRKQLHRRSETKLKEKEHCGV